MVHGDTHVIYFTFLSELVLDFWCGVRNIVWIKHRVQNYAGSRPWPKIYGSEFFLAAFGPDKG
jgi:hypothetical protein